MPELGHSQVQGTRAHLLCPSSQQYHQSAYQYDEWLSLRYTIGGQARGLASARSIEAKLETAEEYQLAGISLWNVYGMFPQLWPLLRIASDPPVAMRHRGH